MPAGADDVLSAMRVVAREVIDIERDEVRPPSVANIPGPSSLPA